MSVILTILSFLAQLIVKILYISVKVAIKTAQVTAKVAVKTGKAVQKAEKATRGARKNVRKVATKTAKTAIKVTKTGVDTAKKTSKAAARGVKNVSNTAKTASDLVSDDKERRDTALNSIKSNAKDKAKSFGKKATGLVVKSPVIALKATLKLLKGLLIFFRILTSFLAFLTTVWSGLLLIFVGAIISCVAFTTVFSNSEAANVVNASESSPDGSSGQSSSGNSTLNGEASDWLNISQGSYKDVPYSTDKESGGRGNVRGQGCGLCAVYIVSEHYSGNVGTFTVQGCASEMDTKFNNKCTNFDRACIPWWFNEAHTELGLTCTQATEGAMNLTELDKVLASGGCCIVNYHDNVKYNGINVWTGAGHYITIIGGSQNDGYMVRDSNGNHERSESAEKATSGVPEWCPYSTHSFSKEYIEPSNYYYFITKK